MSIEEKLSDLLDGTLSPQDEQTFFNDLAGDKELRGEFKQGLAIEVGMHKEAAGIAPSAMLTNSIFTDLGIGAAAGSVASTTAKVGTSWFTGKLPVILSALAGSVITTLLFIGFGPSQQGMQQEANNEAITQDNRVPLVIEMQEAPNEVKYIERQSLQTNDGNSGAPFIDVTENQDEEISFGSEPIFVPENSPRALISFDNTSLLSSQGINVASVYPVSDYNSNLDQPSTLLNNFDLRIRKHGDLFNYNLNNRDLSQFGNDLSGFSNFSLALMYQYSNKEYLGFEVRRESVFQEFNGTEQHMNSNFEAQDIRVTYYQMPSITTIGAFYHRDLFNINNNTRFYTELGLGLNSSINFIARGSIGTKIGFGGPYYLDLGTSINSYFYTHQNASFFSGKFNFYGGLLIEL